MPLEQNSNTESLSNLLSLAIRQCEQLSGADSLLENLQSLSQGIDHALAEQSKMAAQLSQAGAYYRQEQRDERELRILTGESPSMRAVRLAIQQVAATDSTVLITGETGTGKELVARAIHQLSPRRENLLVKVNCAALAQSVIISELFGHEPGAFTGAIKRRVGRFELANGGSIFLDEISEVPPETQVLLLRVLQERVIERVGGNNPISIDVRVIAATNRSLDDAVSQGEFRADLLYRLNVFPIALPPLRDRKQDIPSLISHFIHHFNRRMNKQVCGIEPESRNLLINYSWPGNVRELENIMERAMIISTGDTLELDPRWISNPSLERRKEQSDSGTLAQIERDAISNALARCDGKIYGSGGAAAQLGLKPTTLYSKMRKLGLNRTDD